MTIKINDISKTYKIPKRRNGLLGAFKDLYTRNYSETRAIQNITTEISKGEIVGLIGQNGAGKSTLIKMITGVLKPSKGNILLNGFTPHNSDKRFLFQIGVVFGQRTQLWWDLPVIESLRALKHIYRVNTQEFNETIDDFKKIANINPLLNTPLRNLSLGQRMLCEVMSAFIHRPSIVLLDEPTIGLDIVVKDNIRDMITNLNRKFQTTVLISSHDTDDIQALCKRILILSKGSLIYDGEIGSFSNSVDNFRKVTLSLSSNASNWKSITDNNHIIGKDTQINISQEDRSIDISYDYTNTSLKDIVDYISKYAEIASINTLSLSLEEKLKKLFKANM